MVVLETSRLILRPFTLDDLQAKHAIDSQPAVHRYQGFVQKPDGSRRARTVDETRGWLVRRIAECELQGFGQWAAVLKETGSLIGWAGLQYYLLTDGLCRTPEIELYYGLASEFWGQGLITEAGRELLRYGFEVLQLQRITSVADGDNVRSVNVMRRLGMHLELDRHPTEDSTVLGIIYNPSVQP
jgi:ribosomal-protein-alanine N-acetyltransferase